MEEKKEKTNEELPLSEEGKKMLEWTLAKQNNFYANLKSLSKKDPKAAEALAKKFIEANQSVLEETDKEVEKIQSSSRNK